MKQQDIQTSETRERLSLLLQELHPAHLLHSLLVGLVAGFLVIMIEVSFAAIIFTGDLSDYLVRGIGFTLMGACILGLMMALKSSFDGVIAFPQGSSAVILALMVSAIARDMPAEAIPKEGFLTVISTMMLTSLLAGILFYIVGWFKLCNLIRFIPNPIVGGVLAGTGWLLVKGSFQVMTDVPLRMSRLSAFSQSDLMIKWLPGCLLAVFLLLLLRWFRSVLIMPVLLAAAIGAFYLLLWITQMPVAEASAKGWLLGPLPEKSFWDFFLVLSTSTQAHWNVSFTQIENMGTILIVSLISVLIIARKLELVTRQDINLDYELRQLGIANILAGLAGGPVGFHSLTLTTFVHDMRINSRIVGIVSSGMCGMTVFWGAPLLSFLPKAVFGGLLCFWGAKLLVEWIYDAWFTLSKTDYVLVLLIVFVIGMFGFLEGVFVGILFTLGLFVINYSRMNVVKNVLTGVSYHSNVDRPLPQQHLLRQQGEQIFILKLQGFIFFGTADNLLLQVRQRANNARLTPLRFVILDFRLVRGIDSSALDSFTKMKQFGRAENMIVIFCYLSPELQPLFEREGDSQDEQNIFKIFPDLDHAVEWCEDHILLAENMPLPEGAGSLAEQLKAVFPEPAYVEKLLQYLEKKDVIKGYYLMRQGEPSTGLYFIESGQMTVQLDHTDGTIVRLRTMGPGSVVGELGLYLGQRASASVFTDRHSTIYRLSSEALRRMEKTDPDVATVFHKFIVRLLGDRLTNTNKTLQALLD